MITTLPMLLAALLALQVPPVRSVAPADETLVDRAIAAMPTRQAPPSALDPAELARLSELNPGQEADLVRLLQTEEQCRRPLQEELSSVTLRAVLRDLGSEQVDRLIAFYEGPDFERFRTLTSREGGEATLTDAERAELETIASRYGLDAFGQAMGAAAFGFMATHPLMDKMTLCRSRRDEALEQAGLRLYPATP